MFNKFIFSSIKKKLKKFLCHNSDYLQSVQFNHFKPNITKYLHCVLNGNYSFHFSLLKLNSIKIFISLQRPPYLAVFNTDILRHCFWNNANNLPLPCCRPPSPPSSLRPYSPRSVWPPMSVCSCCDTGRGQGRSSVHWMVHLLQPPYRTSLHHLNNQKLYQSSTAMTRIIKTTTNWYTCANVLALLISKYMS